VFFLQHKRTQGVAFNFALIRRFAISIKKEEARMIRKGRKKENVGRRVRRLWSGMCGGAEGPQFFTHSLVSPPPPASVHSSLAFSHLYTLLHFGRPDFNDFKEEAAAVRSIK